MALRSFGARDLDALVGLGHVGADEAAALEREQEALGRLRFGLHLVAGRHEERLRFDYQKTLAARLGYADDDRNLRSEEHTSELQSLMRISYAVFCLKKKKTM